MSKGRREEKGNKPATVFPNTPTASQLLSVWMGSMQSPEGPKHTVVDSTEEILAYRGWNLEDDPVNGARLRSMFIGAIWDGPSLVADAPPTQMAPHGYHHGVYAMKEKLWQSIYGVNIATSAHVTGVVLLSGLVVEGANGYRAERATIQSLTIHPKVKWPEAEKVTDKDWGDMAVRSPNPSGRASGFSDVYFFPGIVGNAYGSVISGPTRAWPEQLSAYRAAEDLAKRYQCDVEVA